MVAKITINIVCVLMYVFSFWLDTSVFGYSQTTGVTERVTYMFAHSSLLHLVGNLVAFNLLWSALEKINLRWGVIVSFVAAILATWLSEMSVPTVGLSGVCFAMVGVMATRLYGNGDFMFALLTIALAQVAICIWGTSNVLNHAASFAIALLLTIIINSISYHYGKERKNRQVGKSR